MHGPQASQGMEGRVARGRLHRHLDLERTHAKQAEARLRQHLQRLERTCLYHLRLLSWEQRQLRRERERLQRSERLGPWDPAAPTTPPAAPPAAATPQSLQPASWPCLSHPSLPAVLLYFSSAFLSPHLGPVGRGWSTTTHWATVSAK